MGSCSQKSIDPMSRIIEFSQANSTTGAVATKSFAGMAEFLAGAFVSSEVNIIPDTSVLSRTQLFC